MELGKESLLAAYWLCLVHLMLCLQLLSPLVPSQPTTLAQCPVRAPRRRKRKGGHDAAEEYVQDQRRLVDLAEARAAASEWVWDLFPQAAFASVADVI